MSNTDGFVDEVSEALRRDQLFARFKRWAPFAALAVVVLVGLAAWNEWQRAQDNSAAKDRGASLNAALRPEDPSERAEALAALEGGPAAPVVTMLQADALLQADEAAAAAALLSTLPAAQGHAIWQEIANFKALLLQLDSLPADEARAALAGFTTPDAPLRLLAEEQLAYLALAEGEQADAIAALQSILSEADVPAGLQDRATEALRSLGVEGAQ